MWWEAMPTLFIISGALAVPCIFNYYANYFYHGRPYIRKVIQLDEAHMYLRDTRLTGDPYKQNFLECIDEQVTVEAEKKCECP